MTHLCTFQAHFVKVCQKLTHDSGEWMATVMICDDFGTELQVHICNQVRVYVKWLKRCSLCIESV